MIHSQLDRLEELDHSPLKLQQPVAHILTTMNRFTQ